MVTVITCTASTHSPGPWRYGWFYEGAIPSMIGFIEGAIQNMGNLPNKETYPAIRCVPLCGYYQNHNELWRGNVELEELNSSETGV